MKILRRRSNGLGLYSIKRIVERSRPRLRVLANKIAEDSWSTGTPARGKEL